MVEMKICPSCGTEYEPKERFCPRDGTALRTQGGVSDLLGQVVADRYHVLRKLGEGGMGQVYLAEHVKMGRKSALKVMHPSMGSDPDAISRFNREASNASRINHPNVAAVYDFGETPDGLIYLAMEYVEGLALTALLEQQGALPVDRAADIVAQAAHGLAAAHDLGIVHRDLKPDNIMITRNRDGSDCVKVVDFGIAKAGVEGNQKVTRTGLVVGTPEYMSPEQLAGDKLDGRSDVYSLGLVAFNLLTGTLPFPSDSAQESMIMRLTDRPRTLGEMRPDVQWHQELQAVMDRVLARPVADRYPGAPEFARELTRAVEKMPKSALNADGTLIVSAAAPTPTVPPTRVGGDGAPLPPPTHAAPRASAPPRAPATATVESPAAARSHAPLYASAGALLVALLAGGAWLATRDGAATQPGDSASALPGATATLASAAPVTTADAGLAVRDTSALRNYARPSTAAGSGTMPRSPASASTTRAPATPEPGMAGPAAGPSADEAVFERPGTDIADYVTRINTSNAADYLSRANRVIDSPRPMPRAKLFAGVIRATALQTMGREDEACATLRRVRTDYAIMSSSFRQSVDLLLDPNSGSCQ